MNKMKFFGKTYKDLAIIGAIVVVFYQFIPTLYGGAATVFGWGLKYNELNGTLQAQTLKNLEQDTKISAVEKNVSSWRAVWCIAELSKKEKPVQAVHNACQEWIRNP